jgi:hypothetical protein
VLSHSIVDENKAAGRHLAEELRRRTQRAVFDPTTFRNGIGWAQEDYRQACLSVLSTCADLVVLADGWQFSVGCVFELASALDLGLPIVDPHLRPYRTIDLIAALREGEAALAELQYVVHAPLWERALQMAMTAGRRADVHPPSAVTAAKTA